MPPPPIATSKRLSGDDRFINNEWTVDDLNQGWLQGGHDIVSLNAHFEHDHALPAAAQPSSDPATGLTAQQVRAATSPLDGTLVFSIGCHSGLSVAAPQSAWSLDFAQVLLGKGVTYIANTGYGYGDGNAIGYSERLMQLFVEWLPRSATVGQALLNARLAYYNELGSRSLTPYVGI